MKLIGNLVPVATSSNRRRYVLPIALVALNVVGWAAGCERSDKASTDLTGNQRTFKPDAGATSSTTATPAPPSSASGGGRR